jgi:hypothetical protein
MMPAGVAEPYAGSPIAILPKPSIVTPSTSLESAMRSKQVHSSSKPALIADLGNHPGLFHCRDHGEGACVGKGDRLFQENVDPAARCFLNLAFMGMRRDADEQRVQRDRIQHGDEVPEDAGRAARARSVDVRGARLVP